MPDLLRQARECYGRRAWFDAYEAFVAADRADPLGVDDLELLATTANLIGRELESLQYLDRLHRMCVEAGDRPRAARCAFWLGLSLLMRGEVAQSNAWVARGHRLIEDVDCVERGFLLLPLAEQQLRGGKTGAAHATATDAAAIGERFRDPDLSAVARHLQGRALIQQGQVVNGLALLDDAMLAVVAGELSPIMTGQMYCSVIDACRQIYAVGRAREWTFALSRWCEEQDEQLKFTGTCLVHRAEIMQFHGAWPDALAEACHACERFEGTDRKPPAAALYQQAEIHRLRGEFERAEEAYRAASASGYDPQPGLALLRLAQGRTDAASAAIRRLVGAVTDPHQRARLLPAHIETMVAAGDIVEAASACRELEAVAETFDSDVLRAAAAHSQGAIALAEGDALAALEPLRRAFEAWTRLDAPYESAQVRMLIGIACRELGDADTSAMELNAARAAFERLGARPNLARIDRLETRATWGGRRPLTARELEVLRLIAGGHTNRAIATTLSVSERTIDRHVSNILVKLHVPSRAAATAWAYGHDLL